MAKNNVMKKKSDGFSAYTNHPIPFVKQTKIIIVYRDIYDFSFDLDDVAKSRELT